MPLTDRQCQNARCSDGRAFQRFADSGGLYLEVTKTGSKLWRWKYRYGGKEKRLALGLYPGVGLAAARSARDNARSQLSEGKDPSALRREAKFASAIGVENNFEAVARKWWEQWQVGKSERHAVHVIARLKADAFPEIGKDAVTALTAPMFVRMVKKIEERGADDIARRVLQSCGQVMRYAIAHGLCDRNPVADVKPGDILKARRQKNFARIDVGDLPTLMRKIAVYDGSPYTRIAMQLMALCFVRTSELIGARWCEFDLSAAQWKIPAERMKARREHLVPLSRQAISVLRDLQEAHGGASHCKGDVLLFPGERDSNKSMSNNTILFGLYRMGYRGRMTGHGFRGVASTALNEMGFRPDVIEAQLAHVEENRVRAAYNHARYSEERRDLMQAWADYLEAVKNSGEVIPLRRRRLAKAA